MPRTPGNYEHDGWNRNTDRTPRLEGTAGRPLGTRGDEVPSSRRGSDTDLRSRSTESRRGGLQPALGVREGSPKVQRAFPKSPAMTQRGGEGAARGDKPTVRAVEPVTSARPAPPKAREIRADRTLRSPEARSAPEQRSSLAAGLYHGGRHGFQRGFGGLSGFGSPFYYPYGGASFWNCGYPSYWYGNPYWFQPAFHSGFFGYAAPFGSAFFRTGRFSFGFGFSYGYPWGSSFGYGRFFPHYRSYDYYPFTYYSTALYYPAYHSVFHAWYAPSRYVEVYDPYVDYVDEGPVVIDRVPAGRPLLPEPFRSALAIDFPEGLSQPELLARGEQWLQEGRFDRSAEAFRRAWTEQPSDAYAPLQLGHALFAMGRFDLAGYALSEALDRDGSWIERRTDLVARFPSRAMFDDSLRALERHVVEKPLDGEPRFLLAYLYLFSGREFGAHNEFSTLKEKGFDSPHLDRLIAESSARTLAAPKKD